LKICFKIGGLQKNKLMDGNILKRNKEKSIEFEMFAAEQAQVKRKYHGLHNLKNRSIRLEDDYE
jgi:hypothetical protein